MLRRRAMKVIVSPKEFQKLMDIASKDARDGTNSLASSLVPLHERGPLESIEVVIDFTKEVDE
jgi:hypothetical protein